MSNRIKALLYFVVVIFFLGYLNLHYYIDAPGNNNQIVDLVIRKGYSAKRIGKELVKHDIIKNAKIFTIVKRLFFPDYVLKAGEFEIPPNSSIAEILTIINKGIVISHKFKITEGTTTKEILDKILENETLIGGITKKYKDGDFIADTYHYTYGESKMAVLERIYNRSKMLLDDLWETRAPNLPYSSKEEAIILASIIEKETGIASERPRISAVFNNRLKKNMKLQADPTVIYAVTKGQHNLGRPLRKSDLRLDSPYNTYIYTGLPPTAITNAGKAAIEAALNPMHTNEIFFVADGRGGHNFSSTLSKHNNYVNNYRKGIARNDE